MTTGRRPRADGRRNRENLLAAADAAFAELGTGASLEGIARRAGVAIGTLYGHFPHRRALVGALLAQRNEELFARGEALPATDPAGALRRWIDLVVAHAATYRGLAGLLAEGGDDELHDSCVRMTAIGQRLLDRAAEAGVVRAGVSGDDVFALVNAAAWTREHTGADQADRLVDLALHGLLSRPGRTAPAPP
ncbi:TetR/AcrR family transcriptional regulator [Nocardia sp. NRRL S-836]|uniref:TetR/AcrR family transcriptional regulator n=1 Tax=Nocardia sp. NRRL S-836 TaxID=1519492 RepID=UPI0006ADB6C8|nr:TetR/AcrR family transcriptional regulator [Nocardia sp. NRRL S-836]